MASDNPIGILKLILKQQLHNGIVYLNLSINDSLSKTLATAEKLYIDQNDLWGFPKQNMGIPIL